MGKNKDRLIIENLVNKYGKLDVMRAISEAQGFHRYGDLEGQGDLFMDQSEVNAYDKRARERDDQIYTENMKEMFKEWLKYEPECIDHNLKNDEWSFPVYAQSGDDFSSVVEEYTDHLDEGGLERADEWLNDWLFNAYEDYEIYEMKNAFKEFKKWQRDYGYDVTDDIYLFRDLFYDTVHPDYSDVIDEIMGTYVNINIKFENSKDDQDFGTYSIDEDADNIEDMFKNSSWTLIFKRQGVSLDELAAIVNNEYDIDKAELELKKKGRRLSNFAKSVGRELNSMYGDRGNLYFFASYPLETLVELTKAMDDGRSITITKSTRGGLANLGIYDGSHAEIYLEKDLKLLGGEWVAYAEPQKDGVSNLFGVEVYDQGSVRL